MRGHNSHNDNVDLMKRLGSLLTGMERDYPEAMEQLRTQGPRFCATVPLLPAGKGGRLLDVSGTSFFVPFYLGELGYTHVTLSSDTPNECYTLEGVLRSRYTEEQLAFAYFDVEKAPFPVAGDYDQVVCTEVLEHLISDPMSLLVGINTALKHKGQLFLTTPNIASIRGVSLALRGHHPSCWAPYCSPALQHHREYTPDEVGWLLEAAGFSDIKVGTFDAGDSDPNWFDRILSASLVPLRILRMIQPTTRMKRFIWAEAVKASPVRERWPKWLYWPSR